MLYGPKTNEYHSCFPLDAISLDGTVFHGSTLMHLNPEFCSMPWSLSTKAACGTAQEGLASADLARRPSSLPP